MKKIAKKIIKIVLERHKAQNRKIIVKIKFRSILISLFKSKIRLRKLFKFNLI